MKSLVIGAGGFVGGYLLKELSDIGGEIYATKLPSEDAESVAGVIYRDLDVCDTDAVLSIIKDIMPDRIYHLAAVSSNIVAWEKPQLTIQVNVIGTINVLEAVRAVAPSARVLLIGSGEEYGRTEDNNDGYISESAHARPAGIYAVSKLAQNCTGSVYHNAYKLDVISVRAFNHIGPGQSSDFVASNFCRQVVAVEKGGDPVVSVGNLSAIRDFTDVRDVVRAYVLIMDKGVSGKTYNVGGGAVVSISDLLGEIVSLSTATVAVELDGTRLRPSDTPKMAADITELKNDTGWEPVCALKDTLSDMLDYWRKKYV